jgi:hypothetical protein
MIGKPLICNVCNGSMKPYTGPRYSRKAGGFLVVAGAFTSLFWIGPVLGLPLFLIGTYMAGAKRQLWVCEDCNTAIERIELKSPPKKKDREKLTVESSK